MNDHHRLVLAICAVALALTWSLSVLAKGLAAGTALWLGVTLVSFAVSFAVVAVINWLVDR